MESSTAAVQTPEPRTRIKPLLGEADETHDIHAGGKKIIPHSRLRRKDEKANLVIDEFLYDIATKRKIKC